MSEEAKKLDNTEISKKDIQELNDKQSSSSTSTSSTQSKSKKAKSRAPSPDRAASKTSSAVTPAQSLDNIKTNISNPEIQKEIKANVADLLAQFAGRKLTEDEINSLEDVVENNLLNKVFSVKKL